MRSKKLWLILGILVLAVIGLVSYFSLRPPQPQVTSHTLTRYVLEVTPEMNRITVRNADVPGIMASMVMDYRWSRTQPRWRESNPATLFRQQWS